MKIDNNVLVTSICNINITVSLLTRFEPPKRPDFNSSPYNFSKICIYEPFTIKTKKSRT